MMTEYLLAYRRLEMAANRDDKTEDHGVAFESAIADIQLRGTATQISKTVECINAPASGDAGGHIDEVLSQLCSGLRAELGLPANCWQTGRLPVHASLEWRRLAGKPDTPNDACACW